MEPQLVPNLKGSGWFNVYKRQSREERRRYCSYFSCLPYHINIFSTHDSGCLISVPMLIVLQGVRLELCTEDKVGLLAEVTRTFRENGLNVTRAEISTTMDTVLNIFYVTDVLGNPADPKIIEAVRHRIGLTNLQVKELPLPYNEKAEQEEEAVGVAGAVLLSLGSLVRRNLYHLGLIRSYS